MPLLFIGLAVGAGGTFFLSNKVEKIALYTLAGGALYIGYNVFVKK